MSWTSPGEEEDGAWERRLLQRGVHRQPRQAALRVKSKNVHITFKQTNIFLGHPGWLREQVRGHCEEAGDPGGGRPEGQREGRGGREEDQGPRGGAEGQRERERIFKDLFCNILTDKDMSLTSKLSSKGGWSKSANLGGCWGKDFPKRGEASGVTR